MEAITTTDITTTAVNSSSTTTKDITTSSTTVSNSNISPYAVSDLSKGRLKEEGVRAALQSAEGSSAKLISWRYQMLSDTDGATSFIYSIEVTFQVAEKEDKTCYVAKLSPSRDYKHNDFHNLIFKKECTFYCEVIPAITAVLEELGEEPVCFPKCYYHCLDEGNEVIILENLRPKGFQMRDKSQGLDMDHSCLVLRDLAKLHAASYVIQSRHNIVLSEKFDFFQTEWTHKFNLGCDWGTFMSNLMDKRLAAFEKSGRHEKIVKWIKSIKPRVWPLYERQLERKSPYASIIHGDCWINNLLFRYNTEGKPSEVVFLDLQGCRYGSVALDLQHFLNLNVKAEIRRPSLNHLLATYHDSLHRVITAASTALPFTFEELRTEYIDKGFYGALYGLLWLPIMCGPEEVVFKTDNYDDNHGIVNRSENGEDNLPASLIAVMEEWMELGLIA